MPRTRAPSIPSARALAVLLPVLLVAGGARSLAGQVGALERDERSPAETIASDRPGIGNGSWVLAPGVFQVEAGASRFDAGASTLYRLGELLLRYGVGGLELRGGLNSFALRRNGADADGLEDLSVGVKTRIGTSSDDVMTVSALVESSLPTGSDAFTADEALLTLALLADWDFEGGAGLSVNGGYTSAFETLADETWTVTVTPTYSFASVEGLGIYGGWAGTFPPGESVHVIEGGLAWLSGADTQLDLNGGWDPESGDFFVGLGIARRWR